MATLRFRWLPGTNLFTKHFRSHIVSVPFDRELFGSRSTARLVVAGSHFGIAPFILTLSSGLNAFHRLRKVIFHSG
ncbi:hypothetical protein [Rhodococcus sp. NCIMB 12038]|uniref:hypothetical protein n=1 Tax=Rhodococcus sp. NCIMB 12038 TaxID=933800 RepID=UPI00117A70B3|nr:hypothetical protein [Rhodococcus sp. NCIMB 12038]